MSLPIELQTLVPEPWALRAAAAIWGEQVKLLHGLGHETRPECHDKTVHSVARMIQYCHDRALPRDRN